MKQGNWSVLFGCHSFAHSIIVIIAWRKLHGKFPNWWQFICILIHDIGHWGKDYLDNYEEKKRHANLGAKVAKVLFGQRGFDLITGHNIYNGNEKSELYNPDKYANVIAPIWWLTFVTIVEPKLIRPNHTRKESAITFRTAMKKNMENGFQRRGHDIYLEQQRGME